MSVKGPLLCKEICGTLERIPATLQSPMGSMSSHQGEATCQWAGGLGSALAEGEVSSLGLSGNPHSATWGHTSSLQEQEEESHLVLGRGFQGRPWAGQRVELAWLNRPACSLQALAGKSFLQPLSTLSANPR